MSYTTCLNIKKKLNFAHARANTQCTYTFLMILTAHSDYFPNSTNRSDSVMATQCVYCAVRTESLYII